MNVALSQDKRFCWGGRALYGLARHGLIPGARSLAEAAYAVLLAAPHELYVEEVDFVLERNRPVMAALHCGGMSGW
jgi:hypothetical protein